MTNNENVSFGMSSNTVSPPIIGHKEQISFVLDCIKTKKIPNAWLFYGPLGIGKASLALNLAKLLSNFHSLKTEFFNNISEEDIRNPKINVNDNNFFLCKRKWDEKKKIFQKYISIDDIRELKKRFSLSSTDNSYKVCIVDKTEDLNLSASNSLLKILEEPPKNTLFILVSSNPQTVLQTILSRCQKIGFKRLEKKELREISAEFFKKNQFNQLEETIFLDSCNGSAQKLFNFLDKDYIKFFNGLKELFSDLPNLNRRKAIKLFTQNKEYLLSSDPDKSAVGIILRLMASIAKHEIDTRLYREKESKDMELVAAHLYSQISLLRHNSIEYNIDMKKVIFLALNIIELAFAKYKKQ